MAVITRSRLPWLVAVAVAVAAVSAALLWFFAGSAPDEVDLGRVVSDEGDGTAPEEGAGPDGEDDRDDRDGGDGGDGDEEVGGGAEESGEVGASSDGVWVVDTGAVAFDHLEGTGSFVGYRVDEELARIGATTAVGRTPEVAGRITVVEGSVTEARVEADLTKLTSDESRRDGRVQSVFSPDATAAFLLDSDIPADIDPGGAVRSGTATGELTVDGVTRSVEVDLQVARRDGRIVVGGSADILLSDFDVEAPSAPMVLDVADEAVIEWQLYLTRSES